MALASDALAHLRFPYGFNQQQKHFVKNHIVLLDDRIGRVSVVGGKGGGMPQ